MPKETEMNHAGHPYDWNVPEHRFDDLPPVADPLDVVELRHIARLADAFIFGDLQETYGPTDFQREECSRLVDRFVPFLRVAPVYIGFFLCVAKGWKIDKRRTISVQRTFGLTDETARRLKRMYMAFTDKDGLLPSRLLQLDVKILDALAVEFERRLLSAKEPKWEPTEEDWDDFCR